MDTEFKPRHWSTDLITNSYGRFEYLENQFFKSISILIALQWPHTYGIPQVGSENVGWRSHTDICHWWSAGVTCCCKAVVCRWDIQTFQTSSLPALLTACIHRKSTRDETANPTCLPADERKDKDSVFRGKSTQPNLIYYGSAFANRLHEPNQYLNWLQHPIQ